MPADEVRSGFARRRAGLWLFSLAVGGMLAYFTIARDEGRAISGEMALVGVAGVIAYAIYNLVAWRCPACRRHLGRSLNPECCPACAVALR